MKFPFWRRRHDAELDDEINSHLHMAIQDRLNRGETREQAEVAVNRELGNIPLIKQVTRDMWGWRWLEQFAQDLRYAGRMLRRTPGFTVVAVLTLALGIGANTAIFSVADTILLKPLPVSHPEQLALFSWTSGPKLTGDNFWPGTDDDPATGQVTGRSFSYLTFQQLRVPSQALTDVFAFTDTFQEEPDDGQPPPPSGQLVSGNYFTCLGIRPAFGRPILADDDSPSATPVVVISHRYWEGQFGQSAAAVGRTVQLGNTAFTIIGIMPTEFSGTQQLGNSPDLTFPLAMAPRLGAIGPKFADEMREKPWVWGLMLIGRLKPGVSFDEARAELQGRFQATALEGWQANPDSKSEQGRPDTPQLEASPGNKGLPETRLALAPTVRAMAVIVGLALLIVCSNLTSLILARAETRRKEIVVRMALGAGRIRLLRQLLTESLLLAIIGAALGLVFAVWGKDGLLLWIHRTSPSLVIQPQLDLRVMGFTAAVALLTAILVGLAPALRATRVELNQAMKESPGGSGGTRSFIGKALLVAQVAMSIVLLIGAGLFIRTLLNLQRADVGFNSQNLLLFRAFPVWSKHQRPLLGNTYEQVIERIQAIPGVVAATNSQIPLLSGSHTMPFIWVPGRIHQAGEDLTIFEQKVWPNFFETMEMPLVLGRGLDKLDVSHKSHGGPYVAVINETLARRYFPNLNPIGQRFGITWNPNQQTIPKSEEIEIVGVVRDAKYTSVRQEVPPTAFYPFEISPVTFEVRTKADPLTLVAQIRDTVRQLDPDLRLTKFRTLDEQSQLSFAQERHFALLSTLFGLLALLLVSLGLYGLLTYRVTSRTQELGIRMALGARRWDITRLVMRESLMLVLLGVVLGLAVGLAAVRVIASMLYGLSPNDPITIAMAISLMIAVAGLAAYWPARRASQIEPTQALRYE